MIKFFRGFLFALQGIFAVIHERNMRFHLVAAWVVVVMGLYFRITPIEWSILLLCIAIVFAGEVFNTAIEYVVNLIRDECGVPYENKNLGKAKDIAAGAVFLTSWIVAAVGLIILGPYCIAFFSTF